MSDLLYIPRVNPPDEVLHHAILYRDSFSTLVPGSPEPYLTDSLRQALDAGLYKPLDVTGLWEDDEVRNEAFELTWSGFSHDLTIEVFVSKPSESKSEFVHPVSIDDLRSIDRGPWGRLINDAFGLLLECRAGLRQGDYWPDPWHLPDWQIRTLAGTAYALAGRARRDARSSLMVPCYPAALRPLIENCGKASGSDHLLLQVDVGEFLPEPPSGIDTAAVIAFRQRYDDERRRLIKAVEGLVKESARVHGLGEPADIARDVRQELEAALTDMKKAGWSALRGWVKRAAWFGVAAGAGSAFGPAGAAVGAAVGSVAANWASNSVPTGRRRGEHADLNYLYRLRGELLDF